MKISPMTTKLTVNRRLENGQKTLVGTLAQNQQGVFFQYTDDYLAHYASLSPFKLPFDNGIHLCAEQAHQGLFGVFADALPDGWGTLLMDRVFRQQNIEPYQITPMDRLAYIGERALGALEFAPALEQIDTSNPLHHSVNLQLLGQEAQNVFEGENSAYLLQLAHAGSSGGARPKAQIYFDPQHPQQVSSIPQHNMQPWIVKFTSKSLPLAHEEGLCEALYLTLAENLGLEVAKWSLITVGKFHWLATQRFDCSPNGGRYHLHSLSGLLDADYRQPSLDYNELIKASQILCKSPQVGQIQFVRAMFNLFSGNQDDHSKNWAFLQNDAGQWRPAPFYDITFSPTAIGEHCTAYLGYGKTPTKRAIQQLAAQANFNDWSQAKMKIEQIIDELQNFATHAKVMGVSKKTIKVIADYHHRLYLANKRLIE